MEQTAFVDLDEFDENEVDLNEPPRSAVHYLQQGTEAELVSLHQLLAANDQGNDPWNTPWRSHHTATFDELHCLKDPSSLRRMVVALSRKRCPQVVKATLDPKVITPTPSSSDFQREQPSAVNAPSRDWAYAKCDEFSWNRTLLQAKRAKYEKPNDIKFPSWRDSERWRLFCLGEKEAAIEISDETGEPVSKKSLPSTGHAPTPAIVLNLSQNQVNSLIQYLVQIFSEDGYSKALFQWIYSVLAVVEKPLLHDVCAALRSFAKQCREIRSTLTDQCDDVPDGPSPNEFSLFIALISIYFEQKDLADHQ